MFDEPPGVGRGLLWAGGDGLRVAVWVARRAGVFRADRRWSADEFTSRRAVGVEVRQLGRPGAGGAWWAGGSRFSPEAQVAEPLYGLIRMNKDSDSGRVFPGDDAS